MVTVKVPVPSLPAASLAVAVQTLSVFAVTVAAVKTLVATLKLPPFVQLTVGPVVTAVSSVAVSVELPVWPDSTESVAGLNVTTGAVVSGTGTVIVTVSVAVPSLPAASLAVAVQTLWVSEVTVAAVKVFVATSNEPPFVQVTVGPDVTPTASVAVNVEFPVPSDTTERFEGLKARAGAVVSATGVGGVTVLPPPPPPPPQADRSSAEAIEKVVR